MPLIFSALICLIAILYSPVTWVDMVLAASGVALVVTAIIRTERGITLYFFLLTAFIIIPFLNWYEPIIKHQVDDAIIEQIDSEFDTVKATLDSFFLNNTTTLNSLKLLVANEDQLTNEKYQSWLDQITPEKGNKFINIALSDNLVVKYVYPRSDVNLNILNLNQGEEPSTGFIYKNVLTSSRESIIGPFTLIRGALGIINVIPVEGKPNLIISGVLSLDALRLELLELFSATSELTVIIKGYSDPFTLIDNADLKNSIEKTYNYKDMQIDVGIESTLVENMKIRNVRLARYSALAIWLLFSAILSWQNYFARQRDKQRIIIEESESSLLEAQRLGQLGSWHRSDNGDYILSDPLQSLLQVPRRSVPPSELNHFIHANDKKDILPLLRDLENGRISSFSIQHRIRINDQFRWFEHNAGRSQSGKVRGMIRDIQALKDKETQVEELQAYDPLTGASNRHHFQKLVMQNIALCERRETTLGLVLINIDNFRTINETFGQVSGDTLLKAIASRLEDVARKTDLISRLSGDTFAVALVDVGIANQSVLAVENMLRKLKEPYLVPSEVYPQMTASVAMYPDDATDFETLLKRAEQTLVNAKENNRGHYSYYCAEVNAETDRRQQILANLPHALENDQFYLVFQPRVNSTGDHASLSMEALVRWQSPELGFVSPGEFIPIAERTSLIVDIGYWVLNNAFAKLSQYAHNLPKGFSISINLSPRQLLDSDLVEHIRLALQTYDIDANNIEFEVTEYSISANSSTVISNMKALSAMGFTFALDDFGTGFSNLSRLQSLPLDVLKIDMSFVRNIGVDSRSDELVRAIVDLGHTLGLHTVAEGVETIEQVIYLEQLGCEELQGYYFYKPTPIEELVNKL